MSEWNHSQTPRKPGFKQKSAVIFAGAAAAVLTAGIIFQIARPEPTSAGEEKTPAGQVKGAGQATTPKRLEHLARVGDELVTYDQVAMECMKRHGKSVLDNLINRTIIQQACQKRGIVISEEDVDAEIKKIADKFNLPVETWYQMLESEREVSREQYRRDVIWPMIALKSLAGEDVEVTDEDMQKAFVRDYGPKVKARWIMLDNPRRATEVWNKVKETPADFEKLAQEFSIDTNSRPMGGQIPPIARHGGNSTFEESVFKLKEGEVSGVIQYGVNQYVIVLCQGQTEQLVTFEEVKEYLHETLVEQKTQERVAMVFKELQDSTVVQNFLTNTVTGGNVTPSSATKPGEPGRSAPATPAPFSPTGPTVPSSPKSAKK